MTSSHSMPTKDFLVSHLGQEFMLADEAGNSIGVILKSVNDGVPMDETYTCYSMVLLCPPGVQAEQATYRLSKEEQSWFIFMSPTRPEKNGQVLLQASFHFPISEIA